MRVDRSLSEFLDWCCCCWRYFCSLYLLRVFCTTNWILFCSFIKEESRISWHLFCWYDCMIEMQNFNFWKCDFSWFYYYSSVHITLPYLSVLIQFSLEKGLDFIEIMMFQSDLTCNYYILYSSLPLYKHMIWIFCSSFF